MSEVATRIAGIPCIARVTYFSRQNGSYSRHAVSDMDYYGYTECEFQICDRRGRPAPWLERKATDKDLSRIEQEICEQIGDDE